MENPETEKCCWPPFPLEADGCYPGSKVVDRISIALLAMERLLQSALVDEDHYKEHFMVVWYEGRFAGQYLKALGEAVDIRGTWREYFGDQLDIPSVPMAENTNRPTQKDFFRLSEWFQVACQLVSGKIRERERELLEPLEPKVGGKENQGNGKESKFSSANTSHTLGYPSTFWRKVLSIKGRKAIKNMLQNKNPNRTYHFEQKNPPNGRKWSLPKDEIPYKLRPHFDETFDE